MKMLAWLGDGFAVKASNNANFDLDLSIKEFEECIDMLKNNFYKEEYL